MSKLPVAFDPLTLPESDATRYPAPFRADDQKRWVRRLSSHARLRNFGVSITRMDASGDYVYTRKDGATHRQQARSKS
jgi:hypothetical protein